MTRVEEFKANLPETAGSWRQQEQPRWIDSENIFDYMNGAGELYVGYRFDHLEVYEYAAPEGGDILVELYFMKSSDDAFGLLSLDWGGDQVDLADNPPSETVYYAPSSRALYGAGLLRIWAGDVYARIMIYSESPESKEAALSLGRAIAADRPAPPRPKLIGALAPDAGSGWKLRGEKIRYFRSYLVLNSFFFLSNRNILGLDLSTEAVAAPYERRSESGDGMRSMCMLVKYKDEDRAREAISNFMEAYLPEYSVKGGKKSGGPHLFDVEDGWVGYQLKGNYAALVLDSPDRESASAILDRIVSNL